MADSGRNSGYNPRRESASGLPAHPRPSASSSLSLFDNVNAWREQNAASGPSLPASTSSSEEDHLQDDRSAGPKRSSGGGDVDSNDGTKPRGVATTAHQVRVLTAEIEVNPFPDTERRAELAAELGMDRKKVQVWFQNRRQAMRGVGGRAWVTPGAYPGYYGPPAPWAYPPGFPGGGYPPGYPAPSYPLGAGAPMGAGPPPPGYPPFQQPASWTYMPQDQHPGYPSLAPSSADPRQSAFSTESPRRAGTASKNPAPIVSLSRSSGPSAGSLAPKRGNAGSEDAPVPSYGHQTQRVDPLTQPKLSSGPSSLLDDLAALPPEEESPFFASSYGPASGRQRLPPLRSSMSEAALQPFRAPSPGMGDMASVAQSTSKSGEHFRVPDPMRNRSAPNYGRSSDPFALPPPNLFNSDGRFSLPPPMPYPGRDDRSLGLPPLPRRTGSISSAGPLPSLSDVLGGLPPLNLPSLQQSYPYGSQASFRQSATGSPTPALRRRISMESNLMERDSNRMRMTPQSPLSYEDLPPISSSSASFRRPSRPVDTRQYMSSERLQRSPSDVDLKARIRRDSVRMEDPDEEDSDIQEVRGGQQW